MSWHYLQALEAESWEGTCLDGAPDALLSLIPTPARCCSRDNATDACRDSQSGTTCGRSTGDRGAAPSTSSPEDSHARTSAQPGKALASPESEAVCGNTWRELWVKYDLATSGWRTHRCLWEEALPWSSVTLPKWGMMQGGVLWERTTPGLLTNGSGSGFWRTPQAGDGQREAQDADKRKAGGHGVRLMDQVAKWPTPTVCGNYNRKGALGTSGDGLATAVKLKWPTPLASDGVNGGPNQKGGSGDLRLSSAVHKWPTPCLPGNGGSNGKKKLKEMLSWPTPTANEDAAGRPGANMQKMLGNHPDIRQDPDGGQLNPTWVEWLMGWPLLWTSTEPMPPETWRAWGSAFRSEPTDCDASATGRSLPLSSSRGES